MAITSVDPSPGKFDPSFPAYVDAFFETNFPRLIDELNEAVVGFNNGSFTGTSTSSVSIDGALGKTFVTQAGLSFQKGMYVSIISIATADTSNRMVAIVRSYSGTSLVVDPISFAGTGPISNWRISIVPPASSAITKSEVRYETGAGYGTTNTFIRNFGTAAINTGTAIDGVLSPTNGASFEIKTTGVYCVTYHEPAGTIQLHISKNAASLIAAPAVGDRLCSAPAASTGTISFTGTIAAGTFLRAHPQTTGLTSTTGAYFQIVKLDVG